MHVYDTLTYPDLVGISVDIIADEDAYGLDPHRNLMADAPVGKWFDWSDGRESPGSADDRIQMDYYWHTENPNVAILADLRRDPHADTGSDDDGEGYGYALVIPLYFYSAQSNVLELVIPLYFYSAQSNVLEIDCDEDRANGAYCFTADEINYESDLPRRRRRR